MVVPDPQRVHELVVSIPCGGWELGLGAQTGGATARLLPQGQRSQFVGKGMPISPVGQLGSATVKVFLRLVVLSFKSHVNVRPEAGISVFFC